MTRRTVKIETLVTKVNNALKTTRNDQRDFRLGMASFLETILFDANAYAGFGYLDRSQSLDGNDCGIIFDHSAEHKHEYPDDSRRFYYFCKLHRGVR